MLVFYDRTKRQFLILPKNKADDNPEQVCDRVTYYRSTGNFEQISRFTDIDFFDLAESFAEKTTDTTLCGTLETDNPLAAFFEYLHANSSLAESWGKQMVIAYTQMLHNSMVR